jgi:hypothetical protein
MSNEISYQQPKSMFERLGSHTTTAESDDDVPEGIPIKLQKSTIAENGDDRGKRRGGAAKKRAHEKDSEDLQTAVQGIASAMLRHVKSTTTTTTTVTTTTEEVERIIQTVSKNTSSVPFKGTYRL